VTIIQVTVAFQCFIILEKDISNIHIIGQQDYKYMLSPFFY